MAGCANGKQREPPHKIVETDKILQRDSVGLTMHVEMQLLGYAFVVQAAIDA